MKNILVTGGAGYIGSFMTKRLLDDGYSVTVIDSLERGHKEAIDSRAKLVVGNILDKEFLNGVFKQEHFDAVIHFAGYIAVGESMQHPDAYFKNNTFGSLCLLEQMRTNGVNNIIFSSTAGVYGNPLEVPILEGHPKRPESPYGESKLLVEHSLSWYHDTFGMNFFGLRYFNAAGAALDGSMGESHPEETHLIPKVIEAAIHNTEFHLFGNDYDTEDGTCVRDYIHVLDLVSAHAIALKKLERDQGGFFYNVGTGTGFTNKQVISMVEKLTGKQVKIVVEQRRAGDPAVLIADTRRIQQELGFQTQYSDLETIVKSAIAWHTRKINEK